MKIGAYMPMVYGSLAVAVRQMSELGGNCVMVYTGSPKSFTRPNVNIDSVLQAEQIKKEVGFFETIIHGPYIINLSNPEKAKRDRAVSILIDEAMKTLDMNSNLLVFHPGSSLKESAEKGIEYLAESLNEVIANTPKDVTLCVETMAGKGSEVCCNFRQIALLYSLIEDKERLGVCFDTCHVHDSGYDLSVEGLSKTLEEFDKYIGLHKIKVLHVNGSLNARYTCKDRHANIDSELNKLGAEALINLCNQEVFKDVPKILETPWSGDTNQYAKEIQLLKGSLHGYEEE